MFFVINLSMFYLAVLAVVLMIVAVRYIFEVGNEGQRTTKASDGIAALIGAMLCALAIGVVIYNVDYAKSSRIFTVEDLPCQKVLTLHHQDGEYVYLENREKGTFYVTVLPIRDLSFPEEVFVQFGEGDVIYSVTHDTQGEKETEHLRFLEKKAGVWRDIRKVEALPNDVEPPEPE